ncbi:hypothetical protein BY996DRAFT_6537006, partial [Phakopsora pachyrhizi]
MLKESVSRSSLSTNGKDWVKPDMSDDQGFTLTDAGSNPAALKEVGNSQDRERRYHRRKRRRVYDNGTGDQLDVPLGTTAFVIPIRPSSLRLDVKSNGLGIEVENMELPRDQLPSLSNPRSKPSHYYGRTQEAHNRPLSKSS